MGRVGLAAAALTFTLGWDETEFGRLMWWVVEMEDVMKGDKGGLIWCPYLPEPVIMEEEESNNGITKLLVLTNGSQGEVWSLDLVVEVYGPGSWGCRAWPAGDPGYWWRCRGCCLLYRWVSTCHSPWRWLGQVLPSISP
jgi:hypothetical protein